MAIASRFRTHSALVCCLLVSACGGGGGGDEPAPPVIVSLSVASTATVQEAGNPTVQVNVGVNSTAHAGLTIPLEFSGSATRDHDYVVSTDSIVLPPHVALSGIAIDVFRDFDMEGDEAVVISLGPIQGNAQAGPASSVTVTIVDGEAAIVDKTPDEAADGGLVVPAFYSVTEASVEFVVLAFTFPGPDDPPVQLIAEWSSEADFATDVNLLGVFDIPVFSFDTMIFLPPYAFSPPLNRLASNASYFVRVYLHSAINGTGDGQVDNGAFRFSFATNTEGKVVTRCEAPARAGGSTGPDPLFAEQWHLRNRGQTGFSGNRGVPGADLQMNAAIRNGLTGVGFSADPQANLLQGLGASRSHPDSASVDVFNMSFGTIAPSQNSEEDFVGLMKMGTSELRSGRGALYVKAAGNGFNECSSPHPFNSEIGCLGSNADPDQNLPYLINVGVFSADDVKASYSSAGASLWILAPGGEGGVEYPGIITTDQAGVEKSYDLAGGDNLPGGNSIDPHGDYTSTFGGTSSAAPATAGATAILLGVNPELTWREVKHILASSARRIDPSRAEVRAAFNGRPYVAQHAWLTNAAGYGYHNWYGFGALALDEAVAMATAHVPGSLGEFVESQWFPASDDRDLFMVVPDGDGAGVSDTLSVAGLPDSANIEAVILEIWVGHSYASDLGVTITSPGGTKSVVNAPFNAALDSFPGLRRWHLLSNAFYGEGPNGEWRIRVVDLAPGDIGHLRSWRLRFFYGSHSQEFSQQAPLR